MTSTRATALTSAAFILSALNDQLMMAQGSATRASNTASASSQVFLFLMSREEENAIRNTTEQETAPVSDTIPVLPEMKQNAKRAAPQTVAARRSFVILVIGRYVYMSKSDREDNT